MNNTANLKTRTVKELAEMARKRKVLGWHDMRKDQLVRALARQAKKAVAKRSAKGDVSAGPLVQSKNGQSKNGHSKNGHAKSGIAKDNSEVVVAQVPSTNGHAKNGSATVPAKPAVAPATPSRLPAPNGDAGPVLKSVAVPADEKQAVFGQNMVVEKGPKPRSASAERRLQEIKARLAEAKDLALHAVEDDKLVKDRVVVMVRDPYWLHAYWELSRRSVRRAEVSMGPQWHAARPVLRLNEVVRNGTTSAARKTVRDIPIHGGVNNWYIDVQNPPKSYQVEIGYLAPGNRFFALARSNVVSTPMPGSAGSFDRNWAEVAKECDRVYAMSAGVEQEGSGELKEVFEEQMHRPMGESLLAQFGPGAALAKPDFRFQIDTELIVHGKTHPDAHVTLRGEPVRLRPDGSFAVRFSLPDRRHVLPVVANSGDGAEQRTIVLAIDRNTKVMEPVLRDAGE